MQISKFALEILADAAQKSRLGMPSLSSATVSQCNELARLAQNFPALCKLTVYAEPTAWPDRATVSVNMNEEALMFYHVWLVEHGGAVEGTDVDTGS